MVDRFLKWFGVGVVTVGVSAGMVTGAGVALAEDGTPSTAGGGATSDTAESAGTEQDSPSPDPDTDGEATDPGGDDSDTGEEPDDSDVDSGIDEEADDEVDEELEPADEPAAKGDSGTDAIDRPAAIVKQTPRDSDADLADAGATEADDKAVEKVKDDAGEAEAVAAERTTVVVDADAADVAVEEATETPEVEAVAFAAAAELAPAATATAPPLTALLNVIGTFIFNLYGFAIRTVGGPPILPPNSTVTVRSSTLRLDCGCEAGESIEVPADWYVPEIEEGEDPPDRLIFLQHGFLAAGPWYSHTAAALAEQTNSIVVAPSITSNFLAADACWLGAPPMHESMGRLFDDENTALAESALAAGYSGPIPDRVVLVGHSLGGGAVLGTAGEMADNGTLDRLAGVVMLDGVPFDPDVAESLEDLDDVPIYQIAAPKYFWNQFGVGTDALLEARPDQFIGVTLEGGSHVDAMRGGNPLIQFSQQLVSGFSTPENVAAARILMVGWVEDMFDGVPDEGIYLDRGEEFVLDTPAGEATLVDLPNSLTKPFPLNFLRAFTGARNSFFTFEPTCVAQSMGTASVGSCQGSIAA
jgi:pimeloyl-ACP methyl ester carboxylesterase